MSRSLSSSGVQPDAILVGQYEWRALMFVRRVRAGFTPAVRASVFKKIRRLETTTRRFKNLPEARRASCRFPRRWSQAFALLLIRVTTRTSPQPGAARGGADRDWPGQNMVCARVRFLAMPRPRYLTLVKPPLLEYAKGVFATGPGPRARAVDHPPAFARFAMGAAAIYHFVEGKIVDYWASELPARRRTIQEAELMLTGKS